MFLLLIVMMNGKIDMTYYHSKQDCEQALVNATDLGNYKHIKKAECTKIS